MSRSSSDPTTIFSLIKRQLVIHNGAGSVENTSVEDAVGGNNDVNVNGSKSTPTTATAAPNRDASPADSSGSNGTVFQLFDKIVLTNLSHARYCSPYVCYYPKHILQNY